MMMEAYWIAGVAMQALSRSESSLAKLKDRRATEMATEAGGGGQIQQQRFFRVVDTAMVAPAAAGEEVQVQGSSIPLTFFDVKWLHLPPVERVLLYRLSPDADVAAMVGALRTSLSQALRAFYPMAGHVEWKQKQKQSSRRHHLVYRPGDAVPFTTAEYDVDMDDLLIDSGSVRVATLAPLVPRLPKGRAVLAVQATLLRGGLGLAVGVTVHHTTCDGAASTHFLHTWAAAANGNGADPDDDPDPPVIDRQLVPDPRGLYDVYLRGMPPMVCHDDLEFVLGKHQDPGEDKALATFTLPRQLLQSIKSAVAGEAARRGMATPPRCSSILATYGFIWSCYCYSRVRVRRAATTTSTDDDDDDSFFLFSVDQRSRMTPPLPARYFGNCCCPAIARAATEELAAGGIGGLFAACAAVAAAVEEEVREGAQERWHACVDRVKHAVANGTLSVAGSPRFRVYDIDFGFGRPAKVHMVSVAKTGAISVADARAGGGGVEVGISLPEATGDMERFRRCVADEMAWLTTAEMDSTAKMY